MRSPKLSYSPASKVFLSDPRPLVNAIIPQGIDKADFHHLIDPFVHT